MLDDLKLIHERDTHDALGIAEKQWQQLIHEFEIEGDTLSQEGTISNIVYAGMGSSALAAQFGQVWPGFTVPFEIVRGYDLPAYVNASTLVIAASFSGNTEETLEAVAQAETAGARIVIISAGGKLVDLARQKQYPLIVLPKVEQPRFAVWYNLKAILTVFEHAGLYSADDIDAQLATASSFAEQSVQTWLPTVATASNYAKQLALECVGRSIVVYAGPLFWPVGYKWKIAFNENAKQVAWANQYPEFNHNEFMGWTEQPVNKPYTVIDIRSDLEHPRVLKRFEVSERLLSGKRPSPLVIEPKGDTIVEQLVWSCMLGDFVSLYTAILNHVDPMPVALVDKFKKLMED